MPEIKEYIPIKELEKVYELIDYVHTRLMKMQENQKELKIDLFDEILALQEAMNILNSYHNSMEVINND